MKKEIIVYTTSTCKYCTELKEELNKEKISFTEKLNTEFVDDWEEIINTTWIPIFPTILVNDNYIVPRRDFQAIQQAVELIKRFSNVENNITKEIRILESIKTLQFNLNSLIYSFNASQNMAHKTGIVGPTTKENNKKE